MTSQSYERLVIFLHGVGSSGADLAPLAGAFERFLPDTRFVSPDAPEPSAFGAGYQWFSVVGVTGADRPARVAAARAGFDALVQGLIDEAGFADSLDRVAFVGFSQGAIMSLDALATGRWAPACIVAFSGRLASPDPLTPKPNARALLIHGAVDAVIPPSETVEAATRLRAAGVEVESQLLPGIGHTIAPASIPDAGRFLAKNLGVL